MVAVARWLVTPVLLTGVVIASVVMLGRGITPWIVIGTVGIASALLVMLLERVLPYARAWRESRKDLATDAAHLVVSGLAVESLPSLLAPLHGTVWPAHWPLVSQLVVALLLAELCGYWVHRLCHTWRPLWRLHAVHHSAERLYWLNTTRTHPLEALLYTSAVMVPLVLLGAGPTVLALYAVFAGTFRLIQHSNVDIRLGPLNWIFSMAEVHRWHHSRNVDEANANYGAILLVWDLVFGTRKVPADRIAPLDVGLADQPGFPTGYLAQVASPFSPRVWRD